MAHPFRYAVGLQLVAALIVFGVILLAPNWMQRPMWLAVLHGAIAAVLSRLIRMPRWWVWIGGGFVPMAFVAQGLQIPPLFWLGGFVLLLLVFWRTDASRVPLYMSNAMTVEALSGLLPNGPGRVIDLGCGDGRLLRQLARSRPDCSFIGYEHAPLTWAWAKLFGIGLKNLDIRYGSFWVHSLAEYDLVYAFLSPSPMPRLWAKVAAELSPDGKLVSNSFPIPDVRASEQIQVADKRGSILYCYSVGGTT